MLGLLKVGLGVNWIAQSSVISVFGWYMGSTRAAHGRVSYIHGSVSLGMYSLFRLPSSTEHGQYTGVYRACVPTRPVHGRVCWACVLPVFHLVLYTVRTRACIQPCASLAFPNFMFCLQTTSNHLILLDTHQIESESFLKHIKSTLNT